jgi:hypothetical protein
MVLTVSFALSLVTGLVCHHRKRNAQALSLLDASVGASGPHDFAVRKSAVRPRKNLRAPLLRPPHPIPHVRDDREPPLFRGWDIFALLLFLAIREAKYFCEESWTGM